MGDQAASWAWKGPQAPGPSHGPARGSAPPKDWFVGFYTFLEKGSPSCQPAASWRLTQHRQRQHSWVPPPQRGFLSQSSVLVHPPLLFPPSISKACQRWENFSSALGPTLSPSRFPGEDTEVQKGTVSCLSHSASPKQSYSSKR